MKQSRFKTRYFYSARVKKKTLKTFYVNNNVNKKSKLLTV